MRLYRIRWIQAQTTLLLTLGFCNLANAAPKALNKAPDLSTPEKTVRSFVAALNKGDLNAAASCVAGSKPKTPDLPKLWRVQYSDFKSTYSLNKATFTTKGDKATAQIEVKITVGKESAKQAETLKLTRQTKLWKIVPAAKSTIYQAKVGFLQGQAGLLAHPEEAIQIFKRAKAIAQKQARQNKSKQQ